MSNEIKIHKLEFPENVRQLTGMYLGVTDNFTTPLREIINNATDEMLNGHANWIDIINKDTHKMVIDNGRGLPVYVDPDEPEKTIAHTTITSLHSGSKFVESSEITSGIHGLGASATSAVSTKYYIAVNLKKKDISTTLPWIQEAAKSLENPIYLLCCKQGYFVEDMVLDGVQQLSEYVSNEEVRPDFSTAIYFEPDTEIYTSGKASVSLLPLQIILARKDGLEINVNGNLIEKFDFNKEVAKGAKLFLDEKVDFEYRFNSQLTVSGSIGYDNDHASYNNVTLINLIENTQGGFLERRICTALGQALSAINNAIQPADAKIGLILFNSSFSSYKMSFSSQTKEKLTNLGETSLEQVKKRLLANGVSESEVDAEAGKTYLYENHFVAGLRDYFIELIKKNREYFDAIISKIIEYKRALNKLSNQDFLKSKLIMGDSDRDRARQSAEMAKVYEARSRKFAERELYVTEGLSASGHLIKYRNKDTQSVLPLRGKMKNSINMDSVDLVENGELLAIINTIGCGIGSLTDVSKSRYGKIIICTDADSDGLHISNLILAVFLKHCPELIEAGMLYKLETPYYVVDGNKYFYYHEKDQIDFEKSKVEKRKGLGAYTPEEAKKFMLSKDRRLVQIVMDEDEEILKEAETLLFSPNSRKQLMIDLGILA